MMNDCLMTFIKSEDRLNIQKALEWLEKEPAILFTDLVFCKQWFRELLAIEHFREGFHAFMSSTNLRAIFANKTPALRYSIRNTMITLKCSLWFLDRTLYPPMTALVDELLKVETLKFHFSIQKWTRKTPAYWSKHNYRKGVVYSMWTGEETHVTELVMVCPKA